MLQTELAHVSLMIKEIVPQVGLCGTNSHGQPKMVVSVVWDFDLPFDSVLWLVIEAEPAFGEPNRVVLREFVSVTD